MSIKKILIGVSIAWPRSIRTSYYDNYKRILFLRVVNIMFVRMALTRARDETKIVLCRQTPHYEILSTAPAIRDHWYSLVINKNQLNKTNGLLTQRYILYRTKYSNDKTCNGAREKNERKAAHFRAAAVGARPPVKEDVNIAFLCVTPQRAAV